MTQAAINYGRALWELKLLETDVEEAERLLKETPELKDALKSPIVPKSSKRRVIDRVFPEKTRSFLKVLCDRQDIGLADDIFDKWRSLTCEEKGILEATLYYASYPGEERTAAFKRLLCKKYGKKDVRLHMVSDPGLVGGFIIRVGDVETDFSFAGRLKQLEEKLVRR